MRSYLHLLRKGPLPSKSPVRDVMRVARHFSAGYPPKSGESPVGTTEPARENAFKRPYGTHRILPFFPGTKVPGYLQFVPTGLPERALKGPPEIAQGWSEALTLGLQVCFRPALKGRPHLFGRRVRTPLQGLPFALPLTQGFTLGYVRTPLWGCFHNPLRNPREIKKAFRHPERSEGKNLLLPMSFARAQSKDPAPFTACDHAGREPLHAKPLPPAFPGRHTSSFTPPLDGPRRSFDSGSAMRYDKSTCTARLRSG